MDYRIDEHNPYGSFRPGQKEAITQILDRFDGSGTTGIAAIKEGFHYILIEQQAEYCEIARKRVAAVPARLDRWAEAGI